MPLDEEGAKWSCEPCVRGHRSSKCQHFDRLMMKVPKAGRPLAKCPHPKGTCSCQKLYAFMVRIPKGSTCLCRPLYKLPMVITETGQPASPEMPTPTSNPGDFQNHPASRSGFQATPEIASAPLRAVQESTSATNTSVAEGSAGPISPEKQLYHSQHSAFTPPAQSYSGYHHLDVSAPHDPGSTSQPGNQTSLTKEASTSQKNESDRVQSDTRQPPQKKCGSCCCHNPDSSENAPDPPPNQLKNEDKAVSFPPQFQPVSYPALGERPLGWKPDGISSTGHSIPMQNYPYNAVHNPSQGAMSGFQVPHPASAPPLASYPVQHTPQGPHNISPGHLGQYFPPGYSEHRLGAPSIFSYDPAHNCNCGDSCQCLGCASHPFNDTTRQHIQAMGHMMTMDKDDASSERSNGPGNSAFDGQMSPRAVQYPPFPDNSLDFVQTPRADHSRSFSGHVPTPGFDRSPTAPSPAAYGSGYDQMMMQPSAYYTVEYPVSGFNPCIDMTGTCQCGNDCSCIGCLTHSGHNGLPLEPPQQPDDTSPYNTPAFPTHPGISYVQSQEHTPSLDYSPLSPKNQGHTDPPPV